MPWQNQESMELTNKAKALIKKRFNLDIESKVYIASEQELVEKILSEQRNEGRSIEELEKIKYELKYILGRYFAKSDEIWLLENEGLVIDVIVHEMMHAIQKCGPHREPLADYLTFKLTGNKEYIRDSVLKDWEAIEKNQGLKRIIERLQKFGDCEDFD